MKTASVLCYYEGYDEDCLMVTSGNHVADFAYDGYMSAGSYFDFVLKVVTSKNPEVRQIVIKSTTVFPSE